MPRPLLFCRYLFATTVYAIAGNYNIAGSIGNSIDKRVGRKPANTTECIAPMRAHASTAMVSCGIVGI